MSEQKKHTVSELEEKIETYKGKVLDLSFSFGERMANGDMPTKPELAERALYMKMHGDLVKILKETKKSKGKEKENFFTEGITNSADIPKGLADVQQNTKSN